MKISGYILLFSAVFLGVFAQEESERARETLQVIKQSSQSNLDASIFDKATAILEYGFTEGTKLISSSENKIMDGFSSAEKLFTEDPKAAKDIVDQVFNEGITKIFKSVRGYFLSCGKAWALSNDGAKEGLENANQMLQKAGFSMLDALNTGKNLFDQGIGIGAEGKPTQMLLNAVGSTVKAGFAGGYHNIQKSIQTAQQALRDAQSAPTQIEDEKQNCEAAAQDAEGLEALTQINTAAGNALERGANSTQVQKFLEVVTCALGDLVKATAGGKRTMGELRGIIETDPVGARRIYAKQAAAVKKAVRSVNARIFMIVGYIASESGNVLNDKTSSAVLSVALGNTGIFLSLDKAGEVLDIGIAYDGDTPMLAIDAASQTGHFGKLSCIQGIVKASQVFLSVL